MSTPKHKTSLDQALISISALFRTRIVNSYLELKKRYAATTFNPAYDSVGLSAGKFCEAVLRFLQNELTGSYVPFGTHISNFADECQRLIRLPKTSGNESTRVLIPRALELLYTIRGKRGIGHVGGDVEANAIDSKTIISIVDWIICELIRIYHKLSLEDAQNIVDTISERNIPIIWEISGKKRILRNDMSYKDATLLLAYSSPEKGIMSEDLFSWTEHSDLSSYKRDVLRQLHKKRLVEYDEDDEIVFISPKGVEEVESRILAKA